MSIQNYMNSDEEYFYASKVIDEGVFGAPLMSVRNSSVRIEPKNCNLFGKIVALTYKLILK